MPAVKVIYRADRDEFILRWTASGRTHQRSTGLSGGRRNRKEAEGLAAQLLAELGDGESTEWQEFLERFRRDRLSQLSTRYSSTWRSAVASLEAFRRPDDMADVTEAVLRDWQASLTAAGKSRATVRTYVKHLMASLRWAAEVGLCGKPAKAKLPQLNRKMRSRPITARELVAMMRAADQLYPADAGRWRTLLAGLWRSGLRISEAIGLGWTDDWPIYVQLGRTYPVLQIYSQKSKHEQTLPITPDFAAMLRPIRRRSGPVFDLPSRDVDTVGKAISAMGRHAGVRVARGGKHATAHDIRRAFGTRWARRLMPAELQRLMRHADIRTTLDYYIDIESDDLARKLYEAG